MVERGEAGVHVRLTYRLGRVDSTTASDLVGYKKASGVQQKTRNEQDKCLENETKCLINEDESKIREQMYVRVEKSDSLCSRQW